MKGHQRLTHVFGTNYKYVQVPGSMPWYVLEFVRGKKCCYRRFNGWSGRPRLETPDYSRLLAGYGSGGLLSPFSGNWHRTVIMSTDVPTTNDSAVCRLYCCRVCLLLLCLLRLFVLSLWGACLATKIKRDMRSYRLLSPSPACMKSVLPAQDECDHRRAGCVSCSLSFCSLGIFATTAARAALCRCWCNGQFNLSFFLSELPKGLQ